MQIDEQQDPKDKAQDLLTATFSVLFSTSKEISLAASRERRLMRKTLPPSLGVARTRTLTLLRRRSSFTRSLSFILLLLSSAGSRRPSHFTQSSTSESGDIKTPDVVSTLTIMFPFTGRTDLQIEWSGVKQPLNHRHALVIPP
jgi:hypothetical protein